jgi:predicted nucleic acid-binding protein
VPDSRYLVDTSVLARASQEAVGARLEVLALSGRLWTCRLIDLEVAYASRSGDVEAVVAERLALPEAPINAAVLDRALEVAGLMAEAGLHRGAKPVDLVIAAAAEAAHLAVLHYDDDYDRIARVTDQPTEWLADPGALDR